MVRIQGSMLASHLKASASASLIGSSSAAGGGTGEGGGCRWSAIRDRHGEGGGGV